MNNKQIYSIGETARQCGVTQKQIRHWEERGFIPRAERVVCGERSYRQFNETDFRIISKIKGYLDEGFTLAAAAKKASNSGKEVK